MPFVPAILVPLSVHRNICNRGHQYSSAMLVTPNPLADPLCGLPEPTLLVPWVQCVIARYAFGEAFFLNGSLEEGFQVTAYLPRCTCGENITPTNAGYAIYTEGSPQHSIGTVVQAQKRCHVFCCCVMWQLLLISVG